MQKHVKYTLYKKYTPKMIYSVLYDVVRNLIRENRINSSETPHMMLIQMLYRVI